MKREVNITLGYFASNAIRDYFMTSSYVYYTSALIWIVPPGQVSSSLEKLLKPFKRLVWISFLLVLILAFLSVGFLSFYSKNALNFVFGEHVGSPNLNIINIFLGGSLPKLPTRNFARTILMIFMLYCFVLQNSYKGGLFKFMQMTVREREMETTDEIVARNYKFYMLESSKAYFTELPKVMALTVFLDLKEFTQKFNEVIYSDFKGVLLTSKDHLAYRNIQAYPDKFFNHAPETIFSTNIVIYMPKQSCLAQEVDKSIIYLVTGGFIRKWASMFIDQNYLKYQDETKANGLKMKQLFGAFQLLCLGLIISFLSLILEVLLHQMPYNFRF